MKLKTPGKNISSVEVLNISQFGIWIYVEEKEFFLSFDKFPWFKEATLADIYNVQLVSAHHLYWPALDVDLHTESLNDFEKYSLIYKK